jgi:CspA family cold shock protein
MQTGTVKFFDDKKGYGFITQEDKTEIFVHYSGLLTPGFRALTPGQLVSYVVERGPKGDVARQVIIVEPDEGNWDKFIGDTVPIKDE